MPPSPPHFPGVPSGPPWPFIGFVAVLVGVLVLGAALLLWPSPSPDTGPSEEEIAALLDARAPALAAPMSGAVLTVHSDPSGAVVRLGREVVGVTPLRLGGLQPGFYPLSVDGGAGVPLDTLVYLGPGASLRVWHSRPAGDPVDDPLADAGADGGADADAGAELALPPHAEPQRREPAPRNRGNVAASPRGSPQSAPPSAEAAPAPEEAVQTGALLVTSEPTGAQVLLNGRSVGRTPLRLPDLGPGAYHVVVQRSGYRSASETVEVEAGRSRTLWASLEAAQGTLLVVARPWGSLYVNGELRASETDLQHALTLPVGTHRVRAVHPQLGAQERVVEVRAGQATRVVFDFNR